MRTNNNKIIFIFSNSLRNSEVLRILLILSPIRSYGWTVQPNQRYFTPVWVGQLRASQLHAYRSHCQVPPFFFISVHLTLVALEKFLHTLRVLYQANTVLLSQKASQKFLEAEFFFMTSLSFIIISNQEFLFLPALSPKVCN